MKRLLITLFVLVFMQSLCYAEAVIYNTQTGKYHKETCQYAKKCTKNCIKIDKKEAQAKKGVPCKVCGG